MAKKPAASFVLPENLSYMRSLEPSDAGMFAIAPKDGFLGLASIFDRAAQATFQRAPVRVKETTTRGTISHFDTEHPSKRVGTGKKALNSANISTIEQAQLPADASHLLLTGQVRFNAHSLAPAMCNSPSYVTALSAFIAAYTAKGGFRELATRYLLQMVNGSWMWRNRYSGNWSTRVALDDLVLLVKQDEIDMTKGFLVAALENPAHHATFNAMVERIAQALSQPDHAVRVDIAGLVEVGEGGEVYPSQEFASEATESVLKGRGDTKPSKTLSKLYLLGDDEMIATLHARKVGNALRTIDTWYAPDAVRAIAAEPFGANTFESVAYRIHDNDLYSYLKDPTVLTAQIEPSGIEAHHHFVMACLIRGGVYGLAKKPKKEATEEAAEAVAE